MKIPAVLPRSAFLACALALSGSLNLAHAADAPAAAAPAGPITLNPAAPKAGQPDFGPNVLIVDPSSDLAAAQALINQVSEVQKSNSTAQFNNNRFAFLIKPGSYPDLEIPVGFYTHVIGLGLSPDDTQIGNVRCNFYGNVTQTFWRAVENFKNLKGETYWGVSQGTSFRRVHASGGLKLHSEGWSSGGFMGDCKIEGGVNSGSQQQWISRNTELQRWSNAVWNMVFVGVPGAPTSWPSYTAVEKTPIIAEKPYLYFKDGKFAVMVPALKKDSSGVSWNGPAPAPGKSIPIEQFYLAKAGKDTAATINAALESGKNLIFTPGIYPLEDSIKVNRPDTVVFGIGYATLKPMAGKPAMQVADVDGVRVGSILFDATPKNCPTLLEVGPPGSKASHAANPTVISDIFCRVGGAGPGSADVMTTINSNDVIGDNTWLWRADHGSGWSWTEAPNKNGLVVNGHNVIYYGLAVEHTQEYQTIWNGENGRVYFFQCEIPYDVPSQEVWRKGGKLGWASYKVGDHVKKHGAWGMGAYSLFNVSESVLGSAYEVPANAPDVKLHHINSINLGGRVPGGAGIKHVVNDTGESVLGGNRFMRATMADWPVPPPPPAPAPAQ